MSYEYAYPMSSATATVIAYRERDQQYEIVGIRRKIDPFKGMLALPGGFQETGKETLEQTAARELQEETGIKVSPKQISLITVQSLPNRDPRGIIIDHVYAVKITSKQFAQIKAGDDAESIELYSVSRVFSGMKMYADFAFDHGDSIYKWLKSQRSFGGILR